MERGRQAERHAQWMELTMNKRMNMNINREREQEIDESNKEREREREIFNSWIIIIFFLFHLIEYFCEKLFEMKKNECWMVTYINGLPVRFDLKLEECELTRWNKIRVSLIKWNHQNNTNTNNKIIIFVTILIIKCVITTHEPLI